MFRLIFGKNYVVTCYAVVWHHVTGMVCVLCTVLSATQCTAHLPYLWHAASTHTIPMTCRQYTHHTYDMLAVHTTYL